MNSIADRGYPVDNQVAKLPGVLPRECSSFSIVGRCIEAARCEALQRWLAQVRQRRPVQRTVTPVLSDLLCVSVQGSLMGAVARALTVQRGRVPQRMHRKPQATSNEQHGWPDQHGYVLSSCGFVVLWLDRAACVFGAACSCGQHRIQNSNPRVPRCVHGCHHVAAPSTAHQRFTPVTSVALLRPCLS